MAYKDDFPTVLLVEDVADTVGLLEQAFKQYDVPFNAEFAMTGHGAMALVEQKCFDALILDVNLPDVAGTTVGVRIHKYDPALPIAMLTHYPVEVVEPYLAQMGGAKYWPKDMADHPLALIAAITELAKHGRCQRRARETAGRLIDQHPVEGKAREGKLQFPEKMEQSIAIFCAGRGTN